MKLSCSELEAKILNFMVVVHECYTNTTFLYDRSIYAQDLAEAMGWISGLRRNMDAAQVVTKILSHATSKHFGDYWRQGDWGDKEARAFEKLKASITDFS